MQNLETQIPNEGPLSSLTEEAWTGEQHNLRYGGEMHLRKCYRIPIDLLHYNIETGRYRTRFLLLQKANPGALIVETDPHWKDQIYQLLSGSWEDTSTGIGTRDDQDYFKSLVDDIRERDQEHPGIVLETGGVMSGNRRLAALTTLYREEQNPRYRYFKAFIVPAEGSMTSADRWHLEMSAQMPAGRLVVDYDAVDKLLKYREGVECYRQLNPDGEEDSAIRAVATDLGTTKKKIEEELQTLDRIQEYLIAIGHPEEWWLAAKLTEVFTEMTPLIGACNRNDFSLEERSKLKLAVYDIIRNGQGDYRLIRDIRTAVGPLRRRAGTRGIPSAIKILTDNAPSTAGLQTPHTHTSRARAGTVAERFRSEFAAGREKEAPLTKAERAESNLRKLVEILQETGVTGVRQKQLLIDSLSHSKSFIEQALQSLQQ